MKLSIHEILTASLLTGRTSRLPSSTDFDGLVRFVVQEGLAGLVLESVVRHKIVLPETLRNVLHSHATEVAEETRSQREKLAPIAQAFCDAGVQLMALKGMALDTSIYYPPAGLRPRCDADLMVRPRDLEQALDILELSGCRPGQALLRDDFFPRYNCETEYFSGDAEPLRIDLHVRPFHPLRYSQTVPDDGLWSGARLTNLMTMPLWVPSHERMLLHLAVHAACHGCRRLLWLYDMYRYAHLFGSEIDWELLIALARDWKMTYPVYQAFRAVEVLLGVAIPDDVIRLLGKQKPSIADRLTLWNAPREDGHPVRTILVNTVGFRGVRTRAEYLQAVLSPGRDHLAEIYKWRHPGWPAVAHVWRFCRAAARPVLSKG